MKSSTLQYWALQLIGWGGWMLLNVSFVFFFGQDFFQGKRLHLFLSILALQFCWNIFATHLLRTGLRRTSWLQLPINKVIIVFISGVIFTGFLSYYGSRFTARATNLSLATYEKNQALERARTMEKENKVSLADYRQLNGPVTDSTSYNKALNVKQSTGWYRDSNGKWKFDAPRSGRFWWDITFTFILMALWLSIYMVWHYLQKSQRDKLDRLQLEKTVKELEIRTIKSHINPHFIFNSLNSIRALVEENPDRARTAITELSNILRSSLKMEKLETIPLEKELKIVKDYLALEQIRFEERLQVHFDIDENTLQQRVPPMMLQTLVENAVKHGISKQIGGGIIKIISRFRGADFELIVQNTGKIEGIREGFGIKSTRNRLHFLHNGKALFNISNLNDSLVQVRVQMPAS